MADSRTPSPVGLVARGALMGGADVIPGVSGGTMALILGIYPRFVEALGSLNLRWARPLLTAPFAGRVRRRARFAAAVRHLAAIHWSFLVPLGLGIGGAFVVGSRVVPYILGRFPEATFGFFFGLILASVPIPWRMLPRRGAREVAIATLAAGATFWVVGLPGLHTSSSPWFLFVCGAVAICAMVLPGVSGSYVLLMLGQWKHMLDALRSLAIVDLLAFGAGMVTGLISFSRALKTLLHRYPGPTLAALAGVMVGALRSVWPFRVAVATTAGKSLSRAVWPSGLDRTVAVAAIAFAVGVLVLVTLERLGRRYASRA